MSKSCPIMIVPRYWAESKVTTFAAKKQFTIKRFGWSGTSESDARLHAEKRLREALETLARDGDVRRIDHKTSYNGAEGIPIREEVIEKHEDVVISRNSYGALCLNTPDVLFADIDFAQQTPGVITGFAIAVSMLVSVGTAWHFDSWGVFFIGSIVALVIASSVVNALYKLVLKSGGGVEAMALEPIRRLSQSRPELHIRLYRTPLGYRVLLMNDTYDPDNEEALEILTRLGSDKTYVQMCRNQHCFRARVSPKPWRIGMDRLKPRPGVWPINPLRMSERVEWVERYHVKAEPYASCHFLKRMGGSAVHAKAEKVRRIHDDMCRADKIDLKLA